jgi:ribosome-binding factor A
MNTRRQKQIAQLIQDEMSGFLQREGSNYYGHKFVTVTEVAITSDLQNCKIYVSVLNDKEAFKVVDQLNLHIRDIRRRFGTLMRKSLRIIPEIQFYLDDTLDTVFRLEEIFKKMHEKEDQDKSEENKQ